MAHDGRVLDNRQTRVCHMRDLPYTWISAGPFEDGTWRELS
jgi:predicted transglutaminase-like cysteine proteinase